jgi:hypothetical protein
VCGCEDWLVDRPVDGMDSRGRHGSRFSLLHSKESVCPCAVWNQA